MFTLERAALNCGARAGKLQLKSGIVIETPVFMPVGTRGTVKTMPQEQLEVLGAKIILANTYHLFLRPGHELIEQVSGRLHEFMSWPHAILTDSGGFQIYSLASLRKITEEGVRFRSHIDGQNHFFTPEKAMEIQRALGSDIVMAFDECKALPATDQELEKSVELTARWGKRCLTVPLRDYQHLFAIVQGGLNLNLRLKSYELLREAEETSESNKFSGWAVGGLSVGESAEEREEICAQLLPQLPINKPRYLMGVGKPTDLLLGIKQGIDMFDCVLPCRNARNGQAFSKYGPLNIKRAAFAQDTLPLDPDCSCSVCKRYSRAYLRHLYIVGEYLAGQLITHHNLHFYLQLMRQARHAILADKFEDFYMHFNKDYSTNAWGSEEMKDPKVA